MNDEEKKAIDKINKLVEYLRKWNENFTIVPADIKYFEKILDMIKTYIRMIDENIEEILEQSKEIEELKEKNKTQSDCAEPIERTEEMVNMRWVNHNYILKTESEQRERKAYIKGTNDAHELCNKKWEDKIKAKIEIRKEEKANCKDSIEEKYLLREIYVLQSLLEKEQLYEPKNL